MFDYQGYTEERLRRLSDPRRAFKGLYRRRYMTTEMYSFGRYYREEAGYPQHLPLYVYSQHGANYQLVVPPHEIDNDAEAMLVWTPDKQREYQKVSDKPCYVVTCPYIRHRHRHHIAQDPAARGTLIFPAHSTRELETGFDVDRYIAALQTLPAEFRPVAVCLHVHDLRRGVHRRYLERGLPVYSAGDAADVFFGDRLYEILRHFRYAMSNLVGSYAYYSVEMGLPFSLWGEGAKYTNRGDPNLPLGAYDYSQMKEFQIQEKIFSGLHTEITREQKEFVEFALGVPDGISGAELGRILWEAYRKQGRPMRDRLTTARYKVEYGFKKLLYGTLDG